MLCEIAFIDNTAEYMDLENVSANEVTKLTSKYNKPFRLSDAKAVYHSVYCFLVQNDWVYFYWHKDDFDQWCAVCLDLAFYAHETEVCKEFDLKEVVEEFESCFGPLKSHRILTINQVGTRIHNKLTKRSKSWI